MKGLARSLALSVEAIIYSQPSSSSVEPEVDTPFRLGKIEEPLCAAESSRRVSLAFNAPTLTRSSSTSRYPQISSHHDMSAAVESLPRVVVFAPPISRRVMICLWMSPLR